MYGHEVHLFLFLRTKSDFDFSFLKSCNVKGPGPTEADNNEEQQLSCPLNTNIIYPVLDIFFGQNWILFFFFIQIILQPPPPPLLIIWSFSYAGDSLCSRSASRTKHIVWISSLVDILLLDIPVCATLKLCLKFNVNQTGES